MPTIKWQVFGTALVDDAAEFVDDLYDAAAWLDGAEVSGVDWEIEED